MTNTSPDPSSLVACPQCDAVYRLRIPAPREVARCHRCHTVLFAPRPEAIATLLALAISALVLMTIALGYPFLTMSAAGLSAKASVIDAVRAFAVSDMAPLSIAVAALILVLPIFRVMLLIYVLTPLAFHCAAWPYAKTAFRWNVQLRPWSMAEIFMVGVAVAMVKISDLADLHFGPAFWAFAVVALLLAAKDALICERSLWRSLST